MKNPAFEFPLHDMEPPYEKMDGAKIRIVTFSGSAVGDIVTSRDAKKKFGVKVDLPRPIVHEPCIAPIPLGKWETIGTITVDVLKLTKEQIAKIKKVDSSDAAFELVL